MKLYTMKTQIIIGIIAVIIAILAWQFPRGTKIVRDSSQPVIASSYNKAYLTISATGASIKIKENKSGVAYDGGVIKGVHVSNVIHLPKGQLLSIAVKGTGVNLEVEHNIMEFVSISDSGVGTKVVEIQ